MRSSTLVSVVASASLASAGILNYPYVAPVKAVAVLSVGDGTVKGSVSFEQASPGGETSISLNITGLPPNSEHGFHIHQSGDLSGGCASAGGHYNPTSKDHGAPTDAIRHVGDLGNVKADAKGAIVTKLADKLVQLSDAQAVIGRAVVVHEKADDLGKGPATSDTKKTGNAGGRPACGVIGLVG